MKWPYIFFVTVRLWTLWNQETWRKSVLSEYCTLFKRSSMVKVHGSLLCPPFLFSYILFNQSPVKWQQDVEQVIWDTKYTAWVKHKNIFWDVIPCSTINLTFMEPCIITVFLKYNQQHAVLYNILYYCQCSTCFTRFLHWWWAAKPRETCRALTVIKNIV